MLAMEEEQEEEQEEDKTGKIYFIHFIFLHENIYIHFKIWCSCNST